MLKLISIIKPFSAYILTAWIVIILIVSSTPDIPTLKLHSAKGDFRLDYLIHFFEYGFLAFLGYLATSGKNYKIGRGRLLFLFAGLILFAAGDELHQKIIPGRTFNIKDLISNYLGITVSLVLCIFLLKDIKVNEQ